jgi:pimeloyl-ACP methyl ester carboxylesterase
VVDRNIIAVGTTRLAYQLFGEREAPPLVLLHSLGEDATTWDNVARTLSRHRRTYALDLRGHGHSDWPGAYSVTAMRSDVLGFLDALSIERTDLLGHSLGGIVAYLLAEDHPERVRRMVLEDARAPLPRQPTPASRPDRPLPYDWNVVRAIRSQLDSPDPGWWQGLDRITAPTLIVGGGPESPVPQDEIVRMAERVPDCRVVTIPAGHNIHAAEPDAFTETVLDFLRLP